MIHKYIPNVQCLSSQNSELSSADTLSSPLKYFDNNYFQVGTANQYFYMARDTHGRTHIQTVSSNL